MFLLFIVLFEICCAVFDVILYCLFFQWKPQAIVFGIVTNKKFDMIIMLFIGLNLLSRPDAFGRFLSNVVKDVPLMNSRTTILGKLAQYVRGAKEGMLLFDVGHSISEERFIKDYQIIQNIMKVFK